MQHNIEQSTSLASLTDAHNIEYDVSPSGKMLALQGTPLQRHFVRGKKPSPIVWSILLMLGDGLLILCTSLILWALTPHFHLGYSATWADAQGWNVKLIWAGISLLSWSIAAQITQAQVPSCAVNRVKSPLKALLALFLMGILWIILIYPFIVERFITSLITSMLFFAIASPGICLWRIALAECINLPRFRKRGVIVGTNEAGFTLARELRQARRPGITIVGYLSTESQPQLPADGLPILRSKLALRHLAHNDLIDTIIMAIDYKAHPDIFQEIIDATQLGISVIPMAKVYENVSGKIPVEHVGDHWSMAIPVENTSPLYICWRRTLDMCFGLLGTLLLLLTLPILAPLIRFYSPGPLFYRQERLGRNGRPFTIYKFRSMRVDAERSGAQWAAHNDDRITPIGRFLRKTHLDELPQALNILRGEMSLIGPRPEREEFVTELEKTIPFYRCRLMVKPGLTGWAQVKYRYARTGKDTLEKLQYDLYYIQHQTILLDIVIMLKTILEICTFGGA